VATLGRTAEDRIEQLASVEGGRTIVFHHRNGDRDAYPHRNIRLYEHGYGSAA
jgi:hypothetical protein